MTFRATIVVFRVLYSTYLGDLKGNISQLHELYRISMLITSCPGHKDGEVHGLIFK